MIDGVIVPVLDPPAQGALQRTRPQLDPRLDQPPAHEALLSPGVAAIAVAEARLLQVEVERPPRLGAGDHAPGLLLKRVEGAMTHPVGVAVEAVHLLPQ